MYSVSVWERFIADIQELAKSTETNPFGGAGHGYGQGAYLGPRKGGEGFGAKVLSSASNHDLLRSWSIRIPSSGQGKRLSFCPPVDGRDPDLADVVDWCIELRNKAIHREWPTRIQWALTTDAKDSHGKTFNTTIARIALTVFLQIIDQSLRGLCRSAEIYQPDQLYLPDEWLSGQLGTTRGVTDPAQLELWRGRHLHAT